MRATKSRNETGKNEETNRAGTPSLSCRLRRRRTVQERTFREDQRLQTQKETLASIRKVTKPLC